MVSVTAVGNGCRMFSSAAGHGRASSPSSASISSSLPALVQLSGRANNGRGSRSLRIGTSRVRVTVRASARGDDNTDEAGVIKDMELYLDDLSLEYDSVWDTKPAWCQPWTIVGTGVGVISTSWIPFHNVFLTGGVTFFIGLWWFSFLYAYPLAYSDMIAARRKMVEDGSEDTYGRKIGE